MPTRSILELLAIHGAELTEIDGVIGVIPGETDDGTPCVLVLVEALSEELDAKIPGQLEGHPVKVQVLGDVEGETEPGEPGD